MRSVDRVAGRLVGTGHDEQNDKPYILLESGDGVVHRIHQSPDAMKARAAGLRPGNFIELTSTPFVADDGSEHIRVKFRSLGNAHALLTDKTFLSKEVQHLVETTGRLPTEQGFGGWLGDYHRALRNTGRDLVHRGVVQARGDGRYHFDDSRLLDRGDPVRQDSRKHRTLNR